MPFTTCAQAFMGLWSKKRESPGGGVAAHRYVPLTSKENRNGTPNGKKLARAWALVGPPCATVPPICGATAPRHPTKPDVSSMLTATPASTSRAAAR